MTETYERPVAEVFGDLREEVKEFAREEVQLAKREIKDKLAKYRNGAVGTLTGAALACVAVVLVLSGLGWLLAYAFQTLGMNPVFSVFLGMAVIGALTGFVGAALAFTGIRAVWGVSPAPEQTLQTLKNLKPSDNHATQKESTGNQPQRSATELKEEVLQTESRIRHDVVGLTTRISPAHAKDVAANKLRESPFRSVGVAFGVAAAGCYLWAKRDHTRRTPPATLRRSLEALRTRWAAAH